MKAILILLAGAALLAIGAASAGPGDTVITGATMTVPPGGLDFETGSADGDISFEVILEDHLPAENHDIVRVDVLAARDRGSGQADSSLEPYESCPKPQDVNLFLPTCLLFVLEPDPTFPAASPGFPETDQDCVEVATPPDPHRHRCRFIGTFNAQFDADFIVGDYQIVFRVFDAIGNVTELVHTTELELEGDRPTQNARFGLLEADPDDDGNYDEILLGPGDGVTVDVELDQLRLVSYELLDAEGGQGPELPLGAPYVFDAEDLVEGPQTVFMRAYDRYGPDEGDQPEATEEDRPREWHQMEFNFPVVVDTQPPEAEAIEESEYYLGGEHLVYVIASDRLPYTVRYDVDGDQVLAYGTNPDTGDLGNRPHVVLYVDGTPVMSVEGHDDGNLRFSPIGAATGLEIETPLLNSENGTAPFVIAHINATYHLDDGTTHPLPHAILFCAVQQQGETRIQAVVDFDADGPLTCSDGRFVDNDEGFTTGIHALSLDAFSFDENGELLLEEGTRRYEIALQDVVTNQVILDSVVDPLDIFAQTDILEVRLFEGFGDLGPQGLDRTNFVAPLPGDVLHFETYFSTVQAVVPYQLHVEFTITEAESGRVVQQADGTLQLGVGPIVDEQIQAALGVLGFNSTEELEMAFIDGSFDAESLTEDDIAALEAIFEKVWCGAGTACMSYNTTLLPGRYFIEAHATPQHRGSGEPIRQHIASINDAVLAFEVFLGRVDVETEPDTVDRFLIRTGANREPAQALLVVDDGFNYTVDAELLLQLVEREHGSVYEFTSPLDNRTYYWDPFERIEFFDRIHGDFEPGEEWFKVAYILEAGSYGASELPGEFVGLEELPRFELVFDPGLESFSFDLQNVAIDLNGFADACEELMDEMLAEDPELDEDVLALFLYEYTYADDDGEEVSGCYLPEDPETTPVEVTMHPYTAPDDDDGKDSPGLGLLVVGAVLLVAVLRRR